MGEAADLILAERCRAGDQAAMAELLHRHRPLICGLARRVAGDGPDLEDVVQDALVAIVSGVHRFEGRSKLSTWIASATVRTALRHATRRRRRSEHTQPLSGREAMVPAGSSRDDPPQAAESRELGERLAWSLDRLSPDHRAVVVLRHVQEMKVEDVAEVLGVPVGTVKSRLHHARRALRDLMAPYIEPAAEG
jgi:RNA polymerase sigma-70 factor, ECF subfamily